MHLTFRNISLVKTKYGHDIVIKQVGLYGDNGKFVRNCKINMQLVNAIKEAKLKLTLI